MLQQIWNFSTRPHRNPLQHGARTQNGALDGNLPVEARGRAHHVWDMRQLRDELFPMLDPVRWIALKHTDVGSRAQQARLQGRLKPIVNCECNDQGHYPRANTQDGNNSDDRDDRLLPLRSKIAECDEPLELLHCSNSRRRAAIPISPSGRSWGNRMTSRIDFTPLKIIVRRSMPIPSPAVGGIP